MSNREDFLNTLHVSSENEILEDLKTKSANLNQILNESNLPDYVLQFLSSLSNSLQEAAFSIENPNMNIPNPYNQVLEDLKEKSTCIDKLLLSEGNLPAEISNFLTGISNSSIKNAIGYIENKNMQLTASYKAPEPSLDMLDQDVIK